jgi:uncharacterized membrane protein
MAKLLSIVILFLLMLSTGTHALSMGALAKNEVSLIAVGESAKFTLLFWNIENDSYTVRLDSKAPEGWASTISPNNFELNASVGKENIRLPYESYDVKATPVDIIVKPSSSIELGTYNIIVTARSESLSSEIGISQQRSFNLTIEVKDSNYLEKLKKQNTNQDTSSQTSYFIENLKRTDSSVYLYASAIVIILLISFLIYKYS